MPADKIAESDGLLVEGIDKLMPLALHIAVEGIDKLMPLALHIAVERGKEPTFYNILDVVASCCQQWFSSMEETGVFVTLTTGRRFVQKTHTEIVDQATMDEAILHSLRQLCSFQPTVSMQDLGTFISAAFSFPKSLNSDDVLEKVRCSVESMKVWGKVLLEDGRFKLPLGVATDEGPSTGSLEARALPRTKTVRQPVISSGGDDPTDRANKTPMGDAARERATNAEEGELISPTSSSKLTLPHSRSFFSKNHSTGPRDTSVAGSDHISAIPSIRTNIRPQKAPKHQRGKERNSLFVTVKKNTTKKDEMPQWSLSVVQLLFLRAKLGFGKMTLGNGLRPFAFVEMDNVEYGNKAIRLLNGRMLQGGAFTLVVEWAKSADSPYRR